MLVATYYEKTIFNFIVNAMDILFCSREIIFWKGAGSKW